MQDLLDDIFPQFIKDKNGKDLGVFFEIEDYNVFMERIEDLCLGSIAQIIKNKKEETKSLEDVESELVV